MPIIVKAPEGYVRLTIDHICNEGCINLLEAFLEEISMEYCSAYTKYMGNPEDPDNIKHYKDIKEFVESEYFVNLTGLHPQSIIPTLEGRCADDWRKGTYGKVF